MTIVSRIAHRPYPEWLGEGPWWERLDEDFSRWREPFELGPADTVRVGAVAASDVALRGLVASFVAALAIPVGYHPLALARALRERAFWTDLATSGDAARMFPEPPRGVRIVRERAAHPLFRPTDGVCDDIHFTSPYAPRYPEGRLRHLRNKPNREAHARHWRHDHGPRPTVIAIHGFTADLYNLNEWFFAVRWLYEEGYDVLLFTLPFHGRRQGILSPFSGHGFFAAGPTGVNESFAQAIFELRILVDTMLFDGVPQLGVTGVSLGGMTAALLAAAEPRLAFAIPNVPVVSLADLVLEWEPIGSALRTAMKLAGVTLPEIRHMLAPSCPLTWKPVIPHERLMIIGGVGDRLAPPKHALLLWEHWQQCKLHWFPGSHLVHLDRGAYFREMRAFMRALDFVP